ncbi:MAG: hypothetical protein H0W76_25395 [Pyrinomonadaceae bacterium]|nr:hypothetical protein [Pyrinomonadaceae bacterium]
MKIGGQSGHTVVQTSPRYGNRDKTAIRQVASALDVFNSETPEGGEPCGGARAGVC